MVTFGSVIGAWNCVFWHFFR